MTLAGVLKYSMREYYETAKLVFSGKTGTSLLLPKSTFPQLATIKLTEKCNSRCITCNYWQDSSKYTNTISTQKAIDVIGQLRDAGIKSLRFSGGEPLLRGDLFQVLSEFGENDFKSIVLQTNGLLLGKYTEEINNSPLTNITVSLDGVGKNNDNIRGVDGYYDKVVNSLPHLTRKIKIVSTLSSTLSEDLERMLHFCDSNGYDFDFNLPDTSLKFFHSPSVKESVQRLWPNPEQVDVICTLLDKRFPPAYMHWVRQYLLGHEIKQKHCYLGYVSMNIESSGDVTGGCFVLKPLHNIHNQSIQEIINDPEYIERARQMFDMNCPKCTCGWGISLTLENPLANLSVLAKRIKRLF